MDLLETVVVPQFQPHTAPRQRLGEMILVGAYDWVNPAIYQASFRSHTPQSSRRQDILLKLVVLGRVSSHSAICAMDEAGMRPATLFELLAFGARHPDLRPQFPIVAVGSTATMGGSRYVPYLTRFGFGRGLNLAWWAGDWDPSHCFLAAPT